MLQAIEISKEYRRGQLSSTVLSNINLDVNMGEYLAVLGPSGSGKTSLFNILGMLESPTFGRYLFKGQNPGVMSEKETLELRRSEVGYLFSQAHLIDELTVAENVELPLLYQKIKKEERREKVVLLLGEMNLLHRKNFSPKDLSIAEQQRIAIARALVIEPSLILADEPTGQMNVSDGNEILNILGKINDKGTAVVLFTHSRQIAERARRLVQMFDGHLLLHSTAK